LKIKGERLIALSTSLVALCRSKASLNSRVSLAFFLLRSALAALNTDTRFDAGGDMRPAKGLRIVRPLRHFWSFV
jgi:hypothetical protein